MFKYTKMFSTKITPQREAIPGSIQVPNSAGGYTWQLDDWARLDRFLVLGSEGGTFYVGERDLTVDNANVVRRCLVADGPRTIHRIVAISDAGRAPKNDPAIFSLAMAAKLGDEATRRAAYAALPKVCRIGTHLMHFAEYAQGFGGWGRGMRKAVGSWFNARPPADLALQLAKYQSRDGWSNRDLLRLAHPRAASPSHDRLFAWAVKGEIPDGALEDPAFALIAAMTELKHITDVAMAAQLIRERRVPRECVPTELLQHAVIWDALLGAMPMTALIRNLATMTRVGLLAPGSAGTKRVAAMLQDRERLTKARVHPIGVLAALMTYKAGRGVRGSGTWEPVASIVDALDVAFYASFKAIVPAGKRMLLALDVSGSMASGAVAGVPNLTPRIASAAMALVTAATERDHAFVAFTSAPGGYGGQWGGGQSGITSLSISPRQRLDDVVSDVGKLPMGGTDCALPMIWAQKHRVDVDTFCVYTDNETWAGSVHPAQALRAYRDARGISAKLVVVGMTSTGFSIADPNDAGMLDVVGFDTSTPPVIADFARV
ncbi:MAG: TROVE domain-containing protein [Deltaproteobacteria bacterium]|nr:TROVE domain-containing protein [Deltaproteobacteria bacterium]MDQ3295498.1 TROVE domain-containing protein [Myxococcota bacterium]